jgi:DNA-binding response OmpR family regulator
MPVQRDSVQVSEPRSEHIPRFRVLLIEDEELQVRALRLFLGESDILLDAVSTAEQAFPQLAMHPPYDAIITDYRLPGMSGAELVHRLRRPRLIVLTGDSRVAALVPQADVCLLKPCDPRRLLAAIEGRDHE